jgi:uncharacterized protein (DUF433 family)
MLETMPATTWPFIEFDALGVPFIEGTRIKVLEVVLDHLAYAWDADQIHRQHPRLSLPQIYAALGYYHENQAECDRLIADQLIEIDALREQHQNPALAAKLKH